MVRDTPWVKQWLYFQPLSQLMNIHVCSLSPWTWFLNGERDHSLNILGTASYLHYTGKENHETLGKYEDTNTVSSIMYLI